MRPLILLLILSSCSTETNRNMGCDKFIEIEVLTIDSCEYLYLPYNYSQLTHKGNCKYCKQRNEQK